MRNLVCLCAVAIAVAFSASDAHARRCGGRRSHCYSHHVYCHTCTPTPTCNKCVPAAAAATVPAAPVVKPYDELQPPADAAPKPEAPKVEAPNPEAPKVDAPKPEAPKVEAPKAEAPAEKKE